MATIWFNVNLPCLSPVCVSDLLSTFYFTCFLSVFSCFCTTLLDLFVPRTSSTALDTAHTFYIFSMSWKLTVLRLEVTCRYNDMLLATMVGIEPDTLLMLGYLTPDSQTTNMKLLRVTNCVYLCFVIIVY